MLMKEAEEVDELDSVESSPHDEYEWFLASVSAARSETGLDLGKNQRSLGLDCRSKT
jgi:hypothetical protein